MGDKEEMNIKIRSIAQYNLTKDFDNLYNNSKNNDNNYKFMDLILDERNIKLAYRNLKNNKGSKTFGVDNKTIEDLMKLSEKECIDIVRKRLNNYIPNKVRSIYIPKEDGSKRVLGIPTITDRLIQQCIEQVLEPWCEARFYNHSYGFRPLRNTSHALSRIASLINRGKCYYALTFDIESFFDNVDHYLMMQKLWSFGIRDKKLLSIIRSMLSTYNTKGLVQGGILSPLLANIYLTDLDKWVETQWENFPCRGNIHSFHNKKSQTLKHGYIVRYADDFVILTKEYKFALRWKYSIEEFLNKRLHLTTNKEKTNIVNLKQKSFDFLGFNIKVVSKGNTKNGFVAETHISKKSLKRIQKELKNKIGEIQRNTYSDRKAIEYNLMVMGIKNYYKYATMVYLDLDKIGRGINKSMKIRLKDKSKIYKFGLLPDYYKKYNIGIQKETKVYVVCNTPLHIINAIHHKNPMNYRQAMSIYSAKGRLLVKDTDEFSLNQINFITKYLLENSSTQYRNSVELADNRITLYLMRKGKSFITGKLVELEDYHCHHKISIQQGGTHKLNNLILLSKDEHYLIHAVDLNIIRKYLKILNLSKEEIKKVNMCRQYLNLNKIC